MKPLFTLVFLIFWAATASAQDFGNSQVNHIYESIMKAGLFKKIEQGKVLGELGTPEARNALATLFKDDSYWNREAGAAGLIYYPDPLLRDQLMASYTEDFMIDDILEKGFLEHWPDFFPAAQKAYGGQKEEKHRHKLLSLIRKGGGQSSLTFLKSIVENKATDDRRFAFQLLLSSAGPEDDAFFRGFLSDPVLQPVAMDYILAHGSGEDMKIFTPHIDHWHKEFTPRAYMALNLWGSRDEKENRFYKALTSTDEKRIISALAAFTHVTSPRILNELGEIVRNSPYQEFRKQACLDLLYFDDPRVIPLLERFLQEPYIPRRRNGWDAFFTHITFGTTAVFQYLGEKEQEKEFEKTRQKIKFRLDQLKGV